MYKPKRDNKPFGKSSRGKSSPWNNERREGSFGRGSFDRDRESFPATCGSCGKDCRVPFRPNGSKPVYCTNCFKKDEFRPSYESRGASSYEPRRKSFESRDARPSFEDRASEAGSGDVAKQLKAINAKLDAIIDALNDE